MPKTQNRNSVDDLLVPVQLVIPNGAAKDTDADVVQFQLVLGGLPLRSQPTSSGWVNGFWLRNGSQGLMAGIRIGPGQALTPGPGRWAVCIKIIDNPTSPVAAVDVLTIT